MWSNRKVEQALFRWTAWRKSIISEWQGNSSLEILDPNLLHTKAYEFLWQLQLTTPIQHIHTLLQIYWICCIVTDYLFDNPISYDNIRIPDWLATRYATLVVKDQRMLPPRAMTDNTITREENVRHLTQFFGHDMSIMRDFTQYGFFINEPYEIEVFTNDEFYGILTNFEGRPTKKFGIRGRPAQYYDRQAVKCAALKDSGKTYVDIARKLGLHIKEPIIPTTRPLGNDPDSANISDPYVVEQSDSARHLVERGRRILSGLD